MTKKSVLILAAAVAALCAGCAIHSSVSEVQKDVFTISSLGNMGQPGEELLDALYEKGVSYCEERGGKFKLLNQQTNNGTYNGNVRPFAGGPTGGTGWVGGFNAAMNSFSLPTGSYGRARIYFTCEKEQPSVIAAPEVGTAIVKLLEDEEKAVYIAPATIDRLPYPTGGYAYRVISYTKYAKPQADDILVRESYNIMICKMGMLMELGARLYTDDKLKQRIREENKKFDDAFENGRRINSSENQDVRAIYNYFCTRPAE